MLPLARRSAKIVVGAEAGLEGGVAGCGVDLEGGVYFGLCAADVCVTVVWRDVVRGVGGLLLSGVRVMADGYKTG
jgi:hypothetical protein